MITVALYVGAIALIAWAMRGGMKHDGRTPEARALKRTNEHYR